MIIVYFQDKKNIASDIVAVFATDEDYNACSSALAVQAREANCIITINENDIDLSLIINNYEQL